MRTKSALAKLACLGFAAFFTGCYTQLYSQGYAARAVDGPGDYARSTGPEADTLREGDSAGARASADSANRSSTVIVNNNYYRESPYYRGYLVDQWEYPFVSFGFYSSRYRDYYGAYWWNDPWYINGYHRNGRGRYDHGHVSYPPAGGGGTPGPYQSDKRIFAPAPDRQPKGRRNDPPPPAQKSSGGSESGASYLPPAQPSSGSASGDNSSSESGGGSAASGSKEKEDHPKANKGRRR